MQDSIGSCYIILQLHGNFLAANKNEQGHSAIVEIADAMLLGLQVRLHISNTTYHFLGLL